MRLRRLFPVVLAILALLVTTGTPARAVVPGGDDPSGGGIASGYGSVISADPLLAESPGAAPATVAESRTSYIVQVIGEPVVAYDGGVQGLGATRPAKGKKIDPRDAKVQRYVAHLAKKHADLAAAVGAVRFYDYYYSFNGFAAALSPSQANALRKRGDVVSVEADRLEKVDTATTPSFLGLDVSVTGLWARAGGVASAGENVIVGVVDTGIWPEHPSFSDNAGFGDAPGSSGKANLLYGPPPAGWSGSCQSGELWSQDDCNNKIIGARYYLSGFGHFGILKSDVKSARDYDSHGSHTASTIAGNHAVPTTGPAALFGSISGMAPRARIAAYKVCWNGDAGGCANSDSVAAIDQAVADGVDVLNFSISGTSTNYLSAVEVAFLFAGEAGVFVATSAGNSGPDASTVAHISPWLAAVAAGTHNRELTATVTLGNGTVLTGASSTNAVGPAALVSSVTVKKTTASTSDAALCFLGTLDPALATGKIVHCDRGVNARVDKSAAVKEAGGVGMILTNTSASSLNADFHFVPTVHLSHLDRPTIVSYLGTPSPTATLGSAVVNMTAPAPAIASFSSRGPSRAGGGDILKPDFMAPGVDVLAAVSPVGDNGRLFDLLSGTSMSSPHVAGIGALLTQAHPGWSGAAMRSALATTASTAVSSGTSSPFAIGSGQIVPNKATDPGLVYDTTFNDYRNFLKGQGLCNFCFGATPATAIDASDLNQPTIAIGDLAGTQTVTRTVTNVGSGTATYSVTVTAPAGITTTVTPSSFTLAVGASQTFSVDFARTTATLGSYAFGQIVWSDGPHSVRSRIAIRPVAIAAPASRTFTGSAATASGSDSFTVKFGYSGTFTATPQGIVPATQTPGSVTDDPTNNFVTATPDLNQGFTVHTFSIPAGIGFARFSLFDANVDGAHDLDLYVYKGATGATLVGTSPGATSAEQVNLSNPAADTYRVYVHAFQTAGGGTANYTLFSWQVGPDAGNMIVTAPASATSGGSGTVGYTWTGLTTTNTRYLGRISYGNGTSEIGATLIQIDRP